MTMNRKPAGTPVGGQFAPSAHPRPGIELDAGGVDDEQAWRDAGFDTDDAEEWRDAGVDPEEAKQWQESGFNADEAKEWGTAGYDFDSAKEWRDRGFDADEAKQWWVGGYDAYGRWRHMTAEDAAAERAIDISPELGKKRWEAGVPPGVGWLDGYADAQAEHPDPCPELEEATDAVMASLSSIPAPEGKQWDRDEVRGEVGRSAVIATYQIPSEVVADLWELGVSVTNIAPDNWGTEDAAGHTPSGGEWKLDDGGGEFEVVVHVQDDYLPRVLDTIAYDRKRFLQDAEPDED